MSGDDELERIRAEKRRRLRDRLEREGGDDAAGPKAPVEVDGADEFDAAVSDHRLVLVDFYADWCGPCRMLAPVVERIAAETPAAVAKVDADANPGLAQRHGVRGLPTLVLFCDGEPVERLVGMQDEATLRETIEAHAS